MLTTQVLFAQQPGSVTEDVKRVVETLFQGMRKGDSAMKHMLQLPLCSLTDANQSIRPAKLNAGEAIAFCQSNFPIKSNILAKTLA